MLEKYLQVRFQRSTRQKKSDLVLFLPETLPPLRAGQGVVGVELPHEVGGDFDVLLAKVFRSVSPHFGGMRIVGS